MRSFKEILKTYPEARLLLAVREVTRAAKVKAHIYLHGFSVIRRTEMGTASTTGSPIRW